MRMDAHRFMFGLISLVMALICCGMMCLVGDAVERMAFAALALTNLVNATQLWWM